MSTDIITKPMITGQTYLRLMEAWEHSTAADLAEHLRVSFRMDGIVAAKAVTSLERNGYIRINRGCEDGPYTFTERGMRALGL